MNSACLYLLYLALGLTTLPEGFRAKSFREREKYGRAVYSLSEVVDPRPFIISGMFRAVDWHEVKSMRDLWEWYETIPIPGGGEYPPIAQFTKGCRLAYLYWEQARTEVSQAVSDDYYTGAYERIYRAASCRYVTALFKSGLARQQVWEIVRQARSNITDWVEPMPHAP